MERALTRLIRLIGRVREVPLAVTAFRAGQAAHWGYLRATRGWRRLERKVSSLWSLGRVTAFSAIAVERLGIVSPDAAAALRRAGVEGSIDVERLACLGRANAGGRIEIFGTHVPEAGDFPWDTDWLHGHRWEPRYFRAFDFYGMDRRPPSDVKRPWELSRLGFLLPILQAGVLGAVPDAIERATEILTDWRRKNPLAFSVNWQPMEASVRGITLVLGLEMLLCAGEQRPSVLRPWLETVSVHCAFVWRTREYTDIRGNHYAANLVLLLLGGSLLRGWYPEAASWYALAAREIPAEMELQFLPDGVNFEKSIAYHRLVTELFFLAWVALEREGRPLAPEPRRRLTAACRYLATCVRPDGLLPSVGDSDDARLFTMDPAPSRDPSPILGSAAVAFRDGLVRGVAGRLCAAPVWLFGGQALETWGKLPSESPSRIVHYAEGGVVVVHEGQHFLWVDVGEVGLGGRGGHGHNDVLSFEVALDGISVVVDPGSYVYSSDPQARDLFRSTAYHNSVRVDRQEIAPLQSMWRIGDGAQPKHVEVAETDSDVFIRAGHSGYERLADPVLHTRTLSLSRGGLECEDHLACHDDHDVERFLHLDEGIDVDLTPDGAVLTSRGRRWLVEWDGRSSGTKEWASVSPAYGQRHRAPLLKLMCRIRGETTLRFAIRRAESLPS